MLKQLCTLLLLLLSGIAFGQNDFTVMFYNLLNYPTAPPADRDSHLQTLFEAYPPDILLVCELESPAGADNLLDNVLNADEALYEAAEFVFNTSSTANLQQLVYYRADKFELLDFTVIPTTVRDINGYELVLKTANQDTDPITLLVYSSHLNASTGSANELRRFEMIQAFTDTLDDLDPNAFVVFAGDLNLYTGAELAYLELTAVSNPIVFKDPLNRSGNWSNNTDYEDLFTQSTRSSSAPFGGAGAGGGMDDRFDHILVSENLLDDSSTLRYVEDSYLTIGNNGNCYNRSVNNNLCDGFYSEELRDALWNISDHLPLSITIETDEPLLSVDEFTANSGLHFPFGNVVSDQLVVAGSITTASQNIGLYNSLGQYLGSFSFTTGSRLEISTENLPSGLYLLVPEQGQTLKFIKR